MEPERTGRELVSTGSLTSGDGPPTRSRRWVVVLTLAVAGVLAGAFLLHQPATPKRPAAQPAPTPTVGPAYDIHSAGATGRIQVVDVQRIVTEHGHSALGLILRLDVSSGVQDVTTDSFVVSDPDGTTTSASGLTVLVPGSTVVPAANGFRIAAPAAVDLEVIVPVPSGVHVLSVVSATQQKLAGFAVSG